MTPEQEAIQAKREALDKTEAQPQQAPARNRGTAWLNRRSVRVLVWLFTAGIVGALFWIIYLIAVFEGGAQTAFGCAIQGSTASVIAAAATGGCLFLASSLAAWRSREPLRLLLVGFGVLYAASLVGLWEISPLVAGCPAAPRPLRPQIEATDYFVGSVAFSPDGRILASGSAESGIGTPRPHDPIQLWDVRTHRRLGRPFPRRTGKVYSVAFSPDGRILASGSADRTVRFWNVRTHREIGPPVPCGGFVESVAFSPDGRLLASGSDDHTTRLWDVRTHRQLGRALKGHTNEVWSVAFSPNGRVLASGSADETIRLWDVGTHRQLGRPLRNYTTGVISAVHSVAFSPDGRTLASGSYDGTIRFWDVRTHRQLAKVEVGQGHIRSVAFSPDGRLLASGGDDGTVSLWDVSTHRQLGGLAHSHFAGVVVGLDHVNSVAFSPDGRILASSGNDGTIFFWNVADVGR